MLGYSNNPSEFYMMDYSNAPSEYILPVAYIPKVRSGDVSHQDQDQDFTGRWNFICWIIPTLLLNFICWIIPTFLLNITLQFVGIFMRINYHIQRFTGRWNFYARGLFQRLSWTASFYRALNMLYVGFCTFCLLVYINIYHWFVNWVFARSMFFFKL